MADARAQTGTLGVLVDRAEGLLLGPHRRVVGSVGIDEVAEDALDVQHALGLEPGGVHEHAGEVVAPRTPAPQAGVDLEVDAGGLPGGPGRRGDLGERPRGTGREGEVGAHRRDEVGPGREEPGEDRRGDARDAGRHRLAELGDAQVGGAAGQGGAGDWDEAVAVGITLDDRHDVGVTGELAEAGDVVADRVEVDVRPCGQTVGRRIARQDRGGRDGRQGGVRGRDVHGYRPSLDRRREADWQA